MDSMQVFVIEFLLLNNPINIHHIVHVIVQNTLRYIIKCLANVDNATIEHVRPKSYFIFTVLFSLE